eukprot:10895666-Heterocapsa_arctica.AAC.1
MQGRLRSSMVSMVETEGPPWHDSRTVALLNPELVDQGMDRERESLRSFGVLERAADPGKPARCGRVAIATGWVLADRGEKVKARLVARQVNWGTWCDAFAATPRPVSIRFVQHRALANSWRVWTGDVSTAFLHAGLGQDVELVTLPPTEKEGEHPFRLRRALYGMRKAP